MRRFLLSLRRFCFQRVKKFRGRGLFAFDVTKKNGWLDGRAVKVRAAGREQAMPRR